MTKERIVVDEEAGHAGYVVTREVEQTDLETWRGCGPERGQYEERAVAAVSYIPPEHSRAA